MIILMDIDEVGHVLGIIGEGLTASPFTTDKVAIKCSAYLFLLHFTRIILLTSSSENMIPIECGRE